MGLFDFLKKKPKSVSGTELKIPPPPEGAKGLQIPPPEGSPAGTFDLEKPITVLGKKEEFEIPVPPKELELPRLEFPTLPIEEEFEIKPEVEERKPALALPSLEELEAEVPGELPELEGEAPKPTAPMMPTTLPALPTKPILPVAVPISPTLKPVLRVKEVKKEEKEPAFEELEAPVVIRHGAGPLYINLGGYKSVLLSVEDIRDSLKRSNDHLNNMSTTKSREDSALEAWHSSLENIQRKMIFIDRSLFEKQEG